MMPADKVTPPAKLAHFVLRTSNYEAMLGWYQMALSAWPVFQNEQIAFLTYDDEHHRIAIINMPGLARPGDAHAGVHHVAFTYDSLETLLENFERLQAKGIEPALPINHGPTTSIYYADPDGNLLEFQVENFKTVEASTAFFYTVDFAENPIGVEFDPAELLQRLRAGEPEAELKRRASSGARDLSSVEMRKPRGSGVS